MNKSFKTLFTLFVGILFFIPTFTANITETYRISCSEKDKIYKKIKMEEKSSSTIYG